MCKVWRIDANPGTGDEPLPPPLVVLEHKEAISSMVVTSNCVFAGGEGGSVFQWWLGNGETQHIFEGHRAQVHDMLLVDDAKALSSYPSVVVSDSPVPAPNWLNTSATARTPTVLVSAGFDDKIRVWDVLRGTCRVTYRRHTSRIAALARHRDLLFSASWDMTVMAFSLSARQRDPPPRFICRGHTDSVKTLALTADASLLVTGSRDHTLRLWDLAALVADAAEAMGDVLGSGSSSALNLSAADSSSHMAAALADARSAANRLAGSAPSASPAGVAATIATDSEPRRRRKKRRKKHSSRRSRSVPDPVVVEDLAVLAGHEAEVISVAWEVPRTRGARQDIIISLALHPTIRVWSASSRSCLHTLVGHMHFPLSLVVHPYLLFTGSADTAVGIWDYHSGENLRMMPGHEASVRALLVSGKRLISASRDASLIVWDFESPADDDIDVDMIALRIASYDDES